MIETEIFDRTIRLIGQENLRCLQAASVLLFGLGGVGSYVAEALSRAGVGKLGIVDRDTVAYSNINRQLIALHSTVGRLKTEVTAERLLDINPDIVVKPYFLSYEAENAHLIDFREYDYIVDAIDSVKSKLLIVTRAKEADVPLISCMGTGFKLDPSRLKITDIYSTSGCPLSRLMRKELRAAGIDNLKVLFSDEPPPPIPKEGGHVKIFANEQDFDKKIHFNENKCADSNQNVEIPSFASKNNFKEGRYGESSENIGENTTNTRLLKNVASISFVPSIAGLMIAGDVIRDLIGKRVQSHDT